MKYNHMFDLAFAIESEHEDPHQVDVQALLAGVQQRLNALRINPEEAAEAFGYCDSYPIE